MTASQLLPFIFGFAGSMIAAPLVGMVNQKAGIALAAFLGTHAYVFMLWALYLTFREAAS